MKKKIYRFILFRLWGWKLESAYPAHTPQSVVVVFYHTSNWDFPVGIMIRSIMGVDIGFAAKRSLFKSPTGAILRWMGGYPLDRTKHNNYVESVAEIFRTVPDFKICITPEGTRTKVDKLKSGFYYIALTAKIPIVLCKFDWGKKILGFSAPFYPTGNYEADLKKIAVYYDGVKGKNPEFDFDWSGIR